MPIEAKDLIGGAKRYSSMPSYEKQKIDRQVEAMTRECENHEREKIKDGQRMIADLSKEAAGYCHKVIVNGAVTIMTPAYIGGNEFKEEPMTDRERFIESVVRKIVYELSVEEACQYLNGLIKEGAENVSK